MSYTDLSGYKKLSIVAVAFFAFGMVGHHAQAKVSDWQKGFSITPSSTTDFSSASFDQSLQNLRSTGANYVTLIIPYYQNTITSTSLHSGKDTPTDDSLASAIDYAHSIGLKVNLTIHQESQDTNWRAYINPSDRKSWFTNYGLVLNHYAILAQAHSAEMYTLGAELIDMASDNVNSTNTANWQNLIANVRSLYSGIVTYDGNWGGSSWNDELDHVKFWGSLDYIGVSAYYHLAMNSNYTFNELLASWDQVNKTQLAPLNQQYGKPILFTEVGYRSLTGALSHPASWTNTGSVNQQEQSDGYSSLFNYWDKYSYMQGVQFWNWSSNPNAGGPADSDFTPQNKLAQDTATTWFTQNTGPNPTTPTNLVTTYLSDLPSQSETNGWGPVEKDMSNGEQAANDGHTVTINGKKYEKGLGVNAVSKIIYNISNCTKFTSDIGVDDEVTVKGSVVFQVWSGDSKIYDSGLMTYANAAKSISLGITGVTNLALVVTDGGNGNGHDHADWANPQIFCNAELSPPPPPPPTANGTIDIWWPTDGSTISGMQPFKALVENLDIGSYTMTWQLDGGPANPMPDSQADYPHKESLVDVTGWNSNGTGPYTITFSAKDNSGNTIATKNITVFIWH